MSLILVKLNEGFIKNILLDFTGVVSYPPHPCPPKHPISLGLIVSTCVEMAQESWWSVTECGHHMAG